MACMYEVKEGHLACGVVYFSDRDELTIDEIADACRHIARQRPTNKLFAVHPALRSVFNHYGTCRVVAYESDIDSSIRDQCKHKQIQLLDVWP